MLKKNLSIHSLGTEEGKIAAPVVAGTEVIAFEAAGDCLSLRYNVVEAMTGCCLLLKVS